MNGLTSLLIVYGEMVVSSLILVWVILDGTLASLSMNTHPQWFINLILTVLITLSF